MPSPTKITALRIHRSLTPAEISANQALVDMLALGQAIITPRADGTVHPMEGDAVVEMLGTTMAGMFKTLADMRRLHTELRATAVRHHVVAEGVFDTPPASTPRNLGELHAVEPPQAVAA